MPPNSSRPSTNRPSPCQNVMLLSPNSGGNNQFHSAMTSQPSAADPMMINATTPTAFLNHQRCMLMIKALHDSHTLRKCPAVCYADVKPLRACGPVMY